MNETLPPWEAVGRHYTEHQAGGMAPKKATCTLALGRGAPIPPTDGKDQGQ